MDSTVVNMRTAGYCGEYGNLGREALIGKD